MNNPVLNDQNALYQRYIKNSRQSRADSSSLSQFNSDIEIKKMIQRYVSQGYSACFAEGFATRIVPQMSLVRSRCASCVRGTKKCRFNAEACELNRVNSTETNDWVWFLYDRVVVAVTENKENKRSLNKLRQDYPMTKVFPSGDQLVLLLTGSIEPKLKADLIKDIKLLEEK